MIRLIVMGVSGSGKSSVGEAIANRLSLQFIEGDALHPESNVRKMSAGITLTDEDRWPWLDSIGGTLAQAQGGLVVSCSALKKIYRERLRHMADGPLAFVFLEGSGDILAQHMSARTGHFMPISMLESQLDTLEPPTDEPLVLTQNVENSVSEIVRQSVAWVSHMRAGDAFKGGR
ncbi:gluconokinase [Sinorhizobium numidicum]|uniref:Gluconokinase n=1 Tax=Sinorhizobium numidicum TaxID=680248 RepID=A0ABY8CVF2_9HYPH|nr:gluconokinase [Sinorhizobium numidicum]WEX74972.1 gluconokinase [Sinorhizobium numidicum]WEX80966.1 gluconokinase [Sinorhizobium numidicum]